MGNLSNFLFLQKIKNVSPEERDKLIRDENKRKMKEIREKVRKREQETEIEQIKQEIFAEPPAEHPTGTITCILSSDILNN